jgi:hypothetical protein
LSEKTVSWQAAGWENAIISSFCRQNKKIIRKRVAKRTITGSAFNKETNWLSVPDLQTRKQGNAGIYARKAQKMLAAKAIMEIEASPSIRSR